MPGVKIVEALAQCGAVAVLSQAENRASSCSSPASTTCASSGSCEPGDVLDLVCKVETVRGPIGKGKVTATVDGSWRSVEC